MATVVKCTMADALVTHPICACRACHDTACAFHPVQGKDVAEQAERPPTVIAARGPAETFAMIAATLIDNGAEASDVVAGLGTALVQTLTRSTPPETWGRGVDILCACIRTHAESLRPQTSPGKAH